MAIVEPSGRYVPLRVHSEFSLIDSTIRLPNLLKTAVAMGMPAIALSDELNLYGLVKFFKAAESAGVKPIIAADCRIIVDGVTSRCSLYAQNRSGYLNLCRLLSKAWLEREKSADPALHWQWFDAQPELSQGLLALTGYDSNVGLALIDGHESIAKERLSRWAQVFDDRLYIELSRCGRPHENESVLQLAELSVKLGLPAVATNLACFIKTRPESANSVEEERGLDDFDAHEARVCIGAGYVLADPNRPKLHTRLQCLTSVEIMRQRFADLPEALDNTLEFAKRCNASLQLGTYFLPKFPTPSGNSADDFLASECRSGLANRLAMLTRLGRMACSEADYHARLELEIGVINRMGFAGYFLIVSEFIRWAKENGIPVGPGRGSGAGSLVAYALLITDLDPIQYGLLFERFLNPERVSMPDFDVDFCMDRRDEVIQHVSDLYGAEKVSQIITFGTMAAKACIRDAGRVLGMSYPRTDAIAKLIPNTLGIKLSAALKESQELADLISRDDEARALIDLALQLEGLTRNAGKHAGGVIIAPSALTDFSPMYSEGFDPGSVGELPVTQFDKDDVESIGLVKFDFLGLRTLTIIDWAVKAVNKRMQLENKPLIDINTIPLDDPDTFALLCTGHTTAIFQLESRGMKELARKLKPNVFEDIIALGALFRPGPLQSGMVDEFVERKHGRREVVYAHASLEECLKETYGVIVYQEQVMQIARTLANYSLGGADMLRRAMGKKEADKMAKQRASFVEGSVNNQVDGVVATAIFDLMEKFAEYGFNKSHSAAYALVTFQTAWLKQHYPAEFIAAVLTSEADNTDKIVDFLIDAREFNLRILPPDVQCSQFEFAASDAPLTIRYGLGAIKGVGHAVCQEIAAARKAGPFTDIFDFVQRVANARPNRRVMEALIDSGALDSLANHRAQLHANLTDALKASEQTSKAAEAGQSDLFGSALSAPKVPKALAQVAEFDPVELLKREKTVLGSYFSGHPLDALKAELAALNCASVRSVVERPPPPPRADGQVSRGIRGEGITIIVGEIEALRRREAMVFAKLSDASGTSIEVGFFKDNAARYADLLKVGENVLIAGTANFDPFSSSWQLKTKMAYRLNQALTIASASATLHISGAGKSFAQNLKAVLSAYPGEAKIALVTTLQDAAGAAIGVTTLDLAKPWRIAATAECKRALLGVGGVASVEFGYIAARLVEEQGGEQY